MLLRGPIQTWTCTSSTPVVSNPTILPDRILPQKTFLFKEIGRFVDAGQGLDNLSTQHYCCVMLPALTSEGVLPPGIHLSEWGEIWATFGTTPHRQRLLNGFLRAIRALKTAGCKMVYLDGSFVTAKEKPGDFDGCWDSTGVNPALLDPVLLTFDPGRMAQKIKYGGELFPASSLADPMTMRTYIEFFQIDKDTGVAKGLIAIDLERLAP